MAVVSSAAGRPVRVRKTSSSVGRRRPTSSSSMRASASTRTASARRSVPSSTGTATRRAESSTRGSSLPSGASSSTVRPRSSGRRTRISTTSRPASAFSSSGVPVAIDRPWSTMTTWSASWSASSRYCVVSSTSVPSRTSARMASHSSIRLRGSRPGGRLVEEQQPRRADEAGARGRGAGACRPSSGARGGRRRRSGRAGRARRRRRAGRPPAGGRTGGRPSPGSPARSAPARRRRAGRPGR